MYFHVNFIGLYVHHIAISGNIIVHLGKHSISAQVISIFAFYRNTCNAATECLNIQFYKWPVHGGAGHLGEAEQMQSKEVV